MSEAQCVEVALKFLRDCPAAAASEILGVPPSTLAGWRRKGRIRRRQDRLTGRWRYDALQVLLRTEARA